MTRLSLCICFICSFFGSYAGDFAFGVISNEELAIKKYQLDSVSSAVVLNEYGTARFMFDDQKGELNIVFTHHVKLKIFNKEDPKQANIQIPLRASDNKVEQLQDLKAVTYNYVDGRRVETWLDAKNVYREELNKYVALTKFTMPNIQDGSIVEYSYQLISPLIYNFRTWEFQTDIPKINSEFEAIIPATYTYNVVMRGPYKLTDQKSSLVRDGFRLPGWPIDCSRMVYIMKNVPAFIEEDYMTAASNFKSAIYFELATVYLRNGSQHHYTKEWKNVDRELLTDRVLGGQMKQKGVFEDKLPKIIEVNMEDLTKAKAVYEWVRSQIKWNKYYGIFSELGIKKALERHEGNIADINLALVAGLSAAGLDVETVILSTREHGIVNKLNPVISEFNYVIAKLNIDGESYFLDASDPFLPFGMLPLRCINDQGRVLSLSKPSYWVDIKSNAKRHIIYVLTGELSNDGLLTGTMKISNFNYAAYLKRKELANYPDIEQYIERKKEESIGMEIREARVSGVDSVDMGLVEEYQIAIKLFDSLGNGSLYFNPFIVNKIGKNPFTLAERTYPVDFGSLLEETVLVDIALPAGYTLTAKPADANWVLPDRGGQFISRIELDNNYLRCNQALRFNRTIFTSDEYLFLKELFSRVIQLEKADVVLEKKGV
ncbi:DUF3857 domain-containing protein [Olivibacter sp. XZL3]|uniref:DUF3857 domain-containing protein n=1 Tax=Olivibacter sp. XZL3 TaxID=1735116 RepID=UPI0010664CE8|nr:DUF3857 domain-containing protein [Olivibacter sp. XZL3]